jgi:competence protein ComEC
VSKKSLVFLITLGIVITLLSLPLFFFSDFLKVGKASGELEVIFLDVGQGDASLIKTPFGHNILIDGGPKRDIINELAHELPWWDKKIDLMILTHPHDDHVSGLIPVLENYDIKRVLYSGVSHTAPAYLEWLDLIRKKKIPLTIVDRPQTINFGDSCELALLYPRKDLMNKSAVNLNNTSLVAELDCSDLSVLFMGDAETELENELLAVNTLKDIDIIKIGHHGSETSSGQEFLDAVNPEFAVISAGKDNKFNHPSLRVLKRLERLEIEVLRTDLSGTIRF